MLLSTVRDEFAFHCERPKLSLRTVKNYTKADRPDTYVPFLRTCLKSFLNANSVIE